VYGILKVQRWGKDALDRILPGSLHNNYSVMPGDAWAVEFLGLEISL